MPAGMSIVPGVARSHRANLLERQPRFGDGGINPSTDRVDPVIGAFFGIRWDS